MELLSFIVGIFFGGFTLHILYVVYFHMFILGRIEKGIIETRDWIDNHTKNIDTSIFSFTNGFSGCKQILI